MPPLYGVWLFIRDNPAAQYAIAAAGAVMLFFFWLSRHDAGVRREQAARAERKARKVQKQLQEESHDISEKVADARADAPRVAHSDELRDDTYERLFGHSRGRSAGEG